MPRSHRTFARDVFRFYRMAIKDVDPAEKACIHTALLKHCERDTLVMVELRRALRVRATV